MATLAIGFVGVLRLRRARSLANARQFARLERDGGGVVGAGDMLLVDDGDYDFEDVAVGDVAPVPSGDAPVQQQQQQQQPGDKRKRSAESANDNNNDDDERGDVECLTTLREALRCFASLIAHDRELAARLRPAHLQLLANIGACTRVDAQCEASLHLIWQVRRVDGVVAFRSLRLVGLTGRRARRRC